VAAAPASVSASSATVVGGSLLQTDVQPVISVAGCFFPFAFCASAIGVWAIANGSVVGSGSCS
jgi:hypothetical protein